MDFEILGRNTTDKKAVKRRFTVPLQITRASALPGQTGNTKIAFFTRCISALSQFNQSLILALLYPKFCNQYIQLGALGHGSGERKSTALQQLDCVARTKHQCAVFWVSSFAR